MRQAPPLRFTVASLALACSQAFAVPSPYSTLIVFGDSLSDAGQFPDLTGGTPGARFTNRDAQGNFAPVSPMILGGKLGFGTSELGPSTSPGNLARGLADGNNWAVGGYTTGQILASITDTSETVIPPGQPGAGQVLRERPGYLANGLRADPDSASTSAARRATAMAKPGPSPLGWATTWRPRPASGSWPRSSAPTMRG